MPDPDELETKLRAIIDRCASREEFWAELISESSAEKVAEIGVFKGRFAEAILGRCPRIASYTMVDPWRHLEGWNKPANRDDEQFTLIHQEALERTEPWADRRVIQRGTTLEVAPLLADERYDLIYIDADHTLRGILIDLINWYPLAASGGIIGGDDFCKDPWQHPSRYEPTLVFPAAVHFAEAMGAPIYALPWNQFLIEKSTEACFKFIDLTDEYGEPTLGRHLSPAGLLRKTAAEMTRGIRKSGRRLSSRLKRHWSDRRTG